jgi:transposase
VPSIATATVSGPTITDRSACLPLFRGARLLYLPPYSPDLNPIEPSFAKLKALFRKAAARSRDALWNAIGQFLSRFAPQECANYFAEAGYVLPNRETL